jgi:hypothetical protein
MDFFQPLLPQPIEINPFLIIHLHRSHGAFSHRVLSSPLFLLSETPPHLAFKQFA